MQEKKKYCLFSFFIHLMSIWNHAYALIDFLRLPRPQGERRTEPSFAGELGAAKINLLPLAFASRFGEARLGLG
jgi:hypothetical protein